MKKIKKYVVLRHLTMPDKGKCFFSMNTGTNHTHSNKGELWYEIIGYTDEVEDAQRMIYNNYGGLPTMKEFEDYWKKEIEMKNYNQIHSLRWQRDELIYWLAVTRNNPQRRNGLEQELLRTSANIRRLNHMAI